MNLMIVHQYIGALMQRGYGLGGIFQKFFKWVVPVFQQHALPAIESSAKTLGKETLMSLSNIAKDVVSGRNIKEATQQHVSSAIDNLKETIQDKLKGNGIKGSIRKKKFILLKPKQKYTDIFSK